MNGSGRWVAMCNSIVQMHFTTRREYAEPTPKVSGLCAIAGCPIGALALVQLQTHCSICMPIGLSGLQVKAANEAYIQSYPELTVLLNDFVGAVLKDKPADIKAYASQFFARYQPKEDDKGLVEPNTGLGTVTPHHRQ